MLVVISRPPGTDSVELYWVDAVQALVQHEAALGLHRAAVEHRLLGQVVAAEREVDLLEQVAQADVDRLVDHQAQRALLAVLAQVDDRARERLVHHARASR